MISRIASHLSAMRVALALAVLLVLAIGYAASADDDPAARASGDAQIGGISSPCGATVLEALSDVTQRVYDEGVSSERTEIAMRLIKGSRTLREAVERGDAGAARTAAEALATNGHLTNLTVIRGGQTLTSVGPVDALAPLHGSILSAAGAPIASYVASVWDDRGFLSELKGVVEGDIALREGSRSLDDSFEMPAGTIPPAGTLTEHGTVFQYASFPASVYPSGSLRVYLLRTAGSTAHFCGASTQDTLVNTLNRVAALIYAGEGGPHALIQIHNAQQNSALLQAVAERNPVAARKAVTELVYDHSHIVRLRVSAGGHLLADVGGPYVLAPVSAPLRLHGRQIGELTLSIQDDEGYLRLARRLVGLDVLMYMNPTGAHPELVKNSLGPGVGGLSSVPANGTYHYRGHTFSVFTLDARAFPAGTLQIRVLIPIPYS
jgi:DNA-binding FadR family transcriptional regulator